MMDSLPLQMAGEMGNTLSKVANVNDSSTNDSNFDNNFALTPTPLESLTKFGKYLCTEPQLLFKPQEPKNKKAPEFLLLRTSKNTPKN